MNNSSRYVTFIKKYSEVFGVTYEESRRKDSDANKEYSKEYKNIDITPKMSKIEALQKARQQKQKFKIDRLQSRVFGLDVPYDKKERKNLNI